MSGVDDEYETRGRRRRVGPFGRVTGVFSLPVIAAVLSAVTLATFAVGMLDTEDSPGSGLFVQSDPTPDYYGTELEGTPSASPTGSPSPAVSPSLSASPSSSPSPSPARVLAPPPLQAGSIRYESEDAAVVKASVQTSPGGYSGRGFVDYDDVSGSYVEWRVQVAKAGQVTLRLRYANGGLLISRPMDIMVNGVVVKSVAFAVTGGWSEWRTMTITVPLRVGKNRVRAIATTSMGGPHVDYLELAG